MKMTAKEKIKLLEETEEFLNKLDNQVAYVGLENLVGAKTRICMLKTIFYIEEHLDEDEISK